MTELFLELTTTESPAILVTVLDNPEQIPTQKILLYSPTHCPETMAILLFPGLPHLAPWAFSQASGTPDLWASVLSGQI